MIRVGDEVVFVGNVDVHPEVPRGAFPWRGKVLTVEAIGMVQDVPTVLLLGHHNPKRRDGYWAMCCFRKVQRRDLQAWLQTAVPAPHLDKRKRAGVKA